jgi:hypothetical protein
LAGVGTREYCEVSFKPYHIICRVKGKAVRVYLTVDAAATCSPRGYLKTLVNEERNLPLHPLGGEGRDAGDFQGLFPLTVTLSLRERELSVNRVTTR